MNRTVVSVSEGFTNQTERQGNRTVSLVFCISTSHRRESGHLPRVLIAKTPAPEVKAGIGKEGIEGLFGTWGTQNGGAPVAAALGMGKRRVRKVSRRAVISLSSLLTHWCAAWDRHLHLSVACSGSWSSRC